MTRVLLLCRYEDLGPSSRLRSFQYLPFLKTAGFEVEVSPLFDNDYVATLQTGRRQFSSVWRGYLRRLAALIRSRSFDLIWIEKEALPWLPAALELSLLPKKIPLVIDYDDAVFHHYDRSTSEVLRLALQCKHAQLIARAALVVAGNPYIAKYAQAAGARRVEIVPTVVDLRRYSGPTGTNDGPSGIVTVGWIGTAATTRHLRLIAAPMVELSRRGLIRFVAVGASAEASDLPLTRVPWSEQDEVMQIERFDIGVMPLPDSPFERGKCGYKLLQYMACGKPVIASPVGVNSLIVEHGVNGFLASTSKEWQEAIIILSVSLLLRRRMGAEGRRKVESDYCLGQTAPRFVELLRRAASSLPGV